jgi:hypothetical protein
MEIVKEGGIAFTLSSLSEKPEAVVVRDKEDSIMSNFTPNPADVVMSPYICPWIDKDRAGEQQNLLLLQKVLIRSFLWEGWRAQKTL